MRVPAVLLCALLWLPATPPRAQPVDGSAAEELSFALTPRSSLFSRVDETGQLSGFNVDIARALCRELKRRCRFEVMEFAAILPAVAAGRVDVGIANFLRTPERERLVSFSIPYWRSNSAYVGRHELAARTLESLLRDSTVCVIAASGQEKYLQARPAGAVARLRSLSSNQEVLDDLVGGGCGLALLPVMQVLPFMQSAEGQDLGFIGAPLGEPGLGGSVHMVVRPDDERLRAAIDAALQHLIASGEHERLARRYFPFSIL